MLSAQKTVCPKCGRVIKGIETGSEDENKKTAEKNDVKTVSYPELRIAQDERVLFASKASALYLGLVVIWCLPALFLIAVLAFGRAESFWAQAAVSCLLVICLLRAGVLAAR